MNRVYVIGSINNDVVAGAERHPRPGETVRGSTLTHLPGGKGANQAVAAVRAGAPTTMVGCVGADDPGRNLVAFLKSARVDTDFVKQVADAPTGTAIITVVDGENTIVVIPGANGFLAISALEPLIFERGDVVVAQFETPLTTTVEAFRRARDAGATTILNPAPVAPMPPELLNLTNILVVNEHEYESIFDTLITSVMESSQIPVGNTEFAGTLVVTLGVDGVVVWSEFGRLREPGRKVKAVDSTGAGDCFVGYLAAGISIGTPLPEAVARANAAAAISVTRNGAASSIPERGLVTL